MKIQISPPNIQKGQRIGLGAFDGFHKGHQALAEQCDALLSLHPHPNVVLGKTSEFKYLTTPEELTFLYPNLKVLTFTSEIAQMSPLEFLNTVILDLFHPSKIVIGYDYRFGKKGEGDGPLLQKWALENNIDFEVIEPVKEADLPIKSGQIRQWIQENKFNTACHALGHGYPLIGTVIKGDGRGASLGFPTANLELPEEKLLPQPGVYQALLIENKTESPCIIYIGTKPTFEGLITSVEVHIPNRSENLYSQKLTVLLTQQIRPEIKFESKDALIAQIHKDLRCLKTP